jgi:hypothetical protein
MGVCGISYFLLICIVFVATSRPAGAFGVRQLAAAFESGPMSTFFQEFAL